VSLPFVHDPAAPELLGRKLAVSFHIAGESGPMTWHAKALTTSYLTAPGGRAERRDRGRTGLSVQHSFFVFSRCSRHDGTADARTIVALGDSITDGTVSTMNGDDRWPDVLAWRCAIHGGELLH
jgi:hypothetical protein